MLDKADFLFSFDLCRVYHHVDIAKCHWKYLGVEWHGKLYVFTILPFGLSSPRYNYAYYKLVHPLCITGGPEGVEL